MTFDQILDLLFKAGSTFAMLVFVYLMTLVQKKFNLQISAETDAKIRMAAQAAIRGAEEYGKKAIRNSGAVQSGQIKLEQATAALVDAIPGIDPGEASVIIHQELPRVRASLGGAMGSIIVAATSPSSATPSTGV